MNNEEFKPDMEQESDLLKIGSITVHVKPCFCSEKSLYEILYTITSARLKEKST